MPKLQWRFSKTANEIEQGQVITSRINYGGNYHETYIISGTLVGNRIIDHSGDEFST